MRTWGKERWGPWPEGCTLVRDAAGTSGPGMDLYLALPALVAVSASLTLCLSLSFHVSLPCWYSSHQAFSVPHCHCHHGAHSTVHRCIVFEQFIFIEWMNEWRCDCKTQKHSELCGIPPSAVSHEGPIRVSGCSDPARGLDLCLTGELCLCCPSRHRASAQGNIGASGQPAA